MNPSAHNSVPPGSRSLQKEDSFLPSPGGSSSAAPIPTSTPLPQASLDANLTIPDDVSTFLGTASLPRTVGKYVILEEVLSGGMGVVYKARDTELDRIVALKMIKGGLLATAEEIARFRYEARAAARLDHPNIVPVYEIGQEEGRFYFTMAFAWGGTLSQRQGRFVTDRRAAVTLLEKIARAVHYAHQHSILHRDLKPANILFDERGNPWVSDFGLAKFVDGNLELTRTGQMLGTPAYMAPEQASGHSEQVSVQTDVWALGVLMYELLTGQRAFKGMSQEEQLHKVRTAEPPRPRTVNRSLDRALETVILKCLEKEPVRRYASAEDLADDLARWQRGEPVLARPPSRLVRAGRVMRRYRSLALRLVFAAVLLVLLALAWKGISPYVWPLDEGDREAMERNVAQAKRGEEVTLLDESGPPVWWRYQPRRMDARTMLAMGEVFHIYAGKQPGMIELLPAAPKRYRLRAQVQHIHSWTMEGKAGIYFAHGKRPTEQGATHCFFRVAFNDRLPVHPRPAESVPTTCSVKPRPDERDLTTSSVNLHLPIFHETKGDGFSTQTYIACAIGRKFTPRGKVEPMPWRTLEVEVTPEWIKTFWEGELIESTWGGKKADGIDPNKVLDTTGVILSGMNLGLQGRPFLDAEPTLGEGIGLYVEKGIAAFRSVVIEPLPQQ